MQEILDGCVTKIIDPNVNPVIRDKLKEIAEAVIALMVLERSLGRDGLMKVDSGLHLNGLPFNWKGFFH